jgi:hypothetical protein
MKESKTIEVGINVNWNKPLSPPEPEKMTFELFARMQGAANAMGLEGHQLIGFELHPPLTPSRISATLKFVELSNAKCKAIRRDKRYTRSVLEGGGDNAAGNGGSDGDSERNSPRPPAAQGGIITDPNA